MKIRKMRILDFFVGIPICFLLDLLNNLLQFVKFNHNRTSESKVRKILFIKLSEIGSIVLAFPLMKGIKGQYAQSELFFLTFSKNKFVFEILERVVPLKNILTIRENAFRYFVIDTLGVIRRIREERIDMVLDLEFFSRFTAIITYLTNAHKRIGFYSYNFEGLYRGNLLTHKIQYNPLKHISKSYLSFLGVINYKVKATPELDEININDKIALPMFVSNRSKEAIVKDKLEMLGVNKGSNLLLFNLGEGGLHLREWPLNNFVILSKMLLEYRSNNCIVLVGSEEGDRKASLFHSSLKDKRCINLTGKTTLTELFELFHIADMLIANDCGLVHLASLTAIKKFVIFGPESPQVFAPLGENTSIVYSNLFCSPCLSVLNHRQSSCSDNKCLKIISPEEVFKLIKENNDKYEPVIN